MANPSYTYTLTNGTTADASQVMQNFNDILNGVTDGTKDLSLSALTVAGTATLNGNLNIGNTSGDDLVVTASLASNVVPKTTNTYNIGSADIGVAGVYFGTADTDTARIVAGTLAADRTYTLPDAGTAANFVLSEGAAAINGVKTFNDGAKFNDDADQDALTFYGEGTLSSTFTFNGAGGGTTVSYDLKIVRVGGTVSILLPAIQGTSGTGSSTLAISSSLPSWSRPTSDQYAIAARGRNSGTADTNTPVILIQSTGNLEILRSQAGTAWTNATSCGLQSAATITYSVQ